MRKPDIDQLIKDVQNGDSIAVTIVKTVLEQYYTLSELAEVTGYSQDSQQVRNDP